MLETCQPFIDLSGVDSFVVCVVSLMFDNQVVDVDVSWNIVYKYITLDKCIHVYVLVLIYFWLKFMCIHVWVCLMFEHLVVVIDVLQLFV